MISGTCENFQVNVHIQSKAPEIKFITAGSHKWAGHQMTADLAPKYSWNFDTADGTDFGNGTTLLDVVATEYGIPLIARNAA